MMRTVSLKIDAPDGFLTYLATCNTIFNRYVDWCFDNHSYSKKKAHTELYTKFRKEFPQIPSAFIQSIRDTALESVKALKFKFRPKKRPHSSVRYDRRTITLRGSLLSYSWSGKRIKQQIVIPEYFKKYSRWNFQGATIGYSRRERCFRVNLVFSTETPIATGDRVVGVDRGLYNIISLSDGFRYASNGIRAMRRRILFLKKQLQAKGTRSAKRKLKKLSGYEKRFSLNENHKIANLLVNLPYDVYVFEDLSGIRKQKSKGKKLNKWLSNWTFWQLEQLFKYKAEAAGKLLAKKDARYTSQKCSNCSIIDKENRQGSHYVCGRCGHREHSDTNAAKNIRNNHLISIAEKQKMEQAMCQLAECVEPLGSDASRQPCAGGH